MYDFIAFLFDKILGCDNDDMLICVPPAPDIGNERPEAAKTDEEQYGQQYAGDDSGRDAALKIGRDDDGGHGGEKAQAKDHAEGPAQDGHSQVTA